MGYKALIGDVSAGTTRLALLDLSGADIVERKLPPFEIEKIVTSGIGDFSRDVIGPYLANKGLERRDINYGVFAPAGKIDGKRCKLTNSGLEINVEDFGFDAKLVNDFEAKGKFVAVGIEKSDFEYVSLREGIPVARAPVVVAGVGSGYGVCFLEWNEKVNCYVSKAKEWSHSPLGISFADLDKPGEVEIFDGLRKRLGVDVLSWEDFLSTKKGGGIEKAYEVISDLRRENLSKEYLSADNRAAWIHVNARTAVPGTALNRINELEWTVLGRSLRAFGVGEIAQGGIYLTSGMAQNNLITDGNKDIRDDWLVEWLENGFNGYAAHKDWPREIPLRLIIEKEDGLNGAGYFAVDALRER